MTKATTAFLVQMKREERKKLSLEEREALHLRMARWDAQRIALGLTLRALSKAAGCSNQELWNGVLSDEQVAKVEDYLSRQQALADSVSS
jgi:hypothetical protein